MYFKEILECYSLNYQGYHRFPIHQSFVNCIIQSSATLRVLCVRGCNFTPDDVYHIFTHFTQLMELNISGAIYR